MILLLKALSLIVPLRCSACVEFLTTEYEAQTVGAYNADGTVYMKKSSDGKTVSWYATSAGYAGAVEAVQNNVSGTTYYYIAIG